MSYEQATQILAFSAILTAGATPFFFVFWRWFGYWRRHRVAAYTLMFGTLAGLGVTVFLARRWVFGFEVAFPYWARVVAWGLVFSAIVLATVADRQIGLRVRSFGPFFEQRGRIKLKTTRAYGLVRHPIYSAGIGYQLGLFVVTGYLAVAVACLVFTLGAIWFTKQEEVRLIELLDDPDEYERYRRQVPALFPRMRRTRPRSESQPVQDEPGPRKDG